MPPSARNALRHSLFGALLEARRLYDRGLPVVADIVPNETGGTSLTEIGYGRLILGSVVLGRKLAAFTRPGEHVGVMLPNAVGTVVTFFALQSQGRVPAMMNFTAGADGMLSCCAAAGIETDPDVSARRAERQARPAGGGGRHESSFRLSGGCARYDRPAGQAARDADCPPSRTAAGRRCATPAHPRWCCSHRGPRARRRASCTAIARCWPIARSCDRSSISIRRTGCSTRCRCSIRSA